MKDVLISGTASYPLEVPYTVIETGRKGPKPLIVYLHGLGQNTATFQKQTGDMLHLNAYHLHIQGPYPLYDRTGSKPLEKWGRAWYLYDGDQEQFVRSLEMGSGFIQKVIDGMLKHIDVSRLCMFGYSMGAYLAGYFTLSRWKHVNELVMIGGRVKTEVFEDREHHYDHLNVLALHGSNDTAVKPEPQKRSAGQLREWGANVTYRELEAEHQLTKEYIDVTIEWLESLLYRIS